jgi:hypothetical protein
LIAHDWTTGGASIEVVDCDVARACAAYHPHDGSFDIAYPMNGILRIFSYAGELVRALPRGVVGFRRFSSFAAAVALPFVQAGCASPYTYGTPRTLPRRATSHTFGAESFGAFTTWPAQSSSTRGKSRDGFVVLPSYTVRVGVGERADIGLRTSSLGFWYWAFGADLKLHLLKDRMIDVAVDPMVQLTLGVGAHVHLPAMVGFNVAKDVTIVATPGISYVDYMRAASGIELEGAPPAIETRGWLARMGAGINFRLTRLFAIHPEAVLFRSMQPSHDAPFASITWLAVGLGLSWSTQPSFADSEPCPPAAQNHGVSAKQ